MDSFTEALKAQVERVLGQASSSGDVNPLVIIGLTEAILDLGLTEEQLYNAIRSYGRQLAAQVHPDRKPENVSPDRQRQILGAFDHLDSRENFALALAHFKTLRAEDRRESRLLSHSLANLKKRLSVLEGQANALKQDRENLDREKAEFLSQREQRDEVVQTLERVKGRLERKVQSQKVQILKMLEDSTPWKRLHEKSMASLVRLGSENEDGVFVFDAKWVVVAAIWREGGRELTPIDRFGAKRREFLKAIGDLNLLKKETLILDRWKEAVKKYSLANRLDPHVLLPSLSLTIIKLNAGKQELVFGNRLAVAGRRVVGCIPKEGFLGRSFGKDLSEEQSEREEGLLTRAVLRNNMDYESVIEHLSPYLVPGGLLVSVSAESVRKASWSLTCPAFKFTTKRIILAVE